MNLIYMCIGIFTVFVAILELRGHDQGLLGVALFMLVFRFVLRALDFEQSAGKSIKKSNIVMDLYLNCF